MAELGLVGWDGGFGSNRLKEREMSENGEERRGRREQGEERGERRVGLICHVNT